MGLLNYVPGILQHELLFEEELERKVEVELKPGHSSNIPWATNLKLSMKRSAP